MSMSHRLPSALKRVRWNGPRMVLLAVAVLALLVFAGTTVFQRPAQSALAENPGPPTVRVETALAARSAVPVYLTGLGTVQAYYTVTVSSRVDGELVKLGFVEGQVVKRGDLLAQIDPRPYQAALDQAIAAKVKDEAQLANARLDLKRYEMLAPEEFTSKQTLETQRALVSQLEAQIAGDQATIDNARTQLDYTTIRSPIPARTGIRLTDPGNIVRAAAGTGIVVLTQVQPIAVIFTLPADALGAVRTAMRAGPVRVDALSRDGATNLGSGTVGLIDNQVDQTTGTIRVKAIFPNAENKLWPGDFVNARLLERTRDAALTVPSAAVLRGPSGVFTYVVKPDNTVEMRALKLVSDSGGVSVIESGLAEGERVTISNQYRLQPGARVQVMTPGAGAPAPDAVPAAPATPAANSS